MEENIINPETKKEEIIYDVYKGQDSAESPSSGSKIKSLIIGVVVVILLIIVSVFVILPRIQNSQPKNVTLYYWGLWEDKVTFDSVISEYERTHPNVKIVYEKQDIKSLGKYIDRLVTRVNNNTGPDIIRYHNSWLLQIKDLLLPLPQDVISSSGLETQYYGVVKKDLNIDGAYYGIPLNIDTMALFVNEEIFKAAGIEEYPSTWDDLSKVSRSLTVKDENGEIKTSGVALGTFDNIDHASDILSLLFVQNGADLKNLSQTMQNSSDTLSFYTSFSQGDEAVWNDSMESSKLAFARGKLALYFGYSWDIFDLKALNPNLKFKVINPPRLPGRNMTIASYWVEGVSVKSKNSKEAFEFLNFLSSKDTLSKLYLAQTKYRIFGEFYPRMDMADLLKDNQLIYPFIQQAPNAVSTIFSSNTYDDGMNSSLNAYLANAVRSVVSGASSVESAIETLSSGVSQVLSRYERKVTP